MKNNDPRTNFNIHKQKLEREIGRLDNVIRDLQKRQDDTYRGYERSGKNPVFYYRVQAELECINCNFHGYTFQRNIKTEELLGLKETSRKKGK